MKKENRVGFVGAVKVREGMRFDGVKGKGKSYTDDFETNKSVIILGAPDDTSIHAAILHALTAIGKSMDDVHIVSDEELRDNGRIPLSVQKSIIEGNQYLIIRDAHEALKDKTPTEKLITPIREYAPIKEKKKKGKTNHPFGKFMGRRGKNW